jgi:hypothetical protein
MRYELKKLLMRKELWIVFGLSLLAVVLLSLRNDWADADTRRAERTLTAAYFDLPLDEAEADMTQRLDSAEPAEQAVLTVMLKSVGMYREHEDTLRAHVKTMYRDLENAHTEYERRDITRALKLYNRKREYRVTDARRLELACLNVNDDKPMQYLWLLILCTMLSPLFAAEHESGMYQVLYCTQRGKSGLFLRKIAGGMLCAALLSVIDTALNYLLVWLRTGLSFRLFLAPVQCVMSCRSCPYAMTLLGFAVITAMMRALIGAWAVSLTALTSCFLRRSGAVFGVTCLFAAVPVMLCELGETVPSAALLLKQIGLIRLSYPIDYFAQYETVNVLGYPVDRVFLSVGCTVGITLLLLAAAFAVCTAPIHERKRVKSCSASKV